MPKPELVTHPEITAALARVEAEIDAETANVLRARIRELESQVAGILSDLDIVERGVAEEQTRTAILTAFDTR